MGLTTNVVAMVTPHIPLIPFYYVQEVMFLSTAVVSCVLKQSNVFLHHKVL